MDIPFELKGDHVRLCDLLKLVGVAESGGQGKHMVAAGEVKVDGQPENRKSAKIRTGQTVECRGATIKVTAEAGWEAVPEPPAGEQQFKKIGH